MINHPRFLLIGIGGVYNYGCEAIVRGTEIVLRRQYPDAEIVYASRRPSEDSAHLEGSGVKIIPRRGHGRYSSVNLCRKALSLMGVHWHPRRDSLGMLRNVDGVFSIGGDLYTLGASGEYSMSFPKFGDAAVRRGIPFVLWGASVGPFSDNPSAEKAFRQHLGRLTLITAREPATVKYLEGLGVGGRVVSCSDPAFVVGPDIQAPGSRNGDQLTIGVNLSPLSIRHSRHSVVEALQGQARSLERVIQASGGTVVLIPHVVCAFKEGDDDLRYLRRLWEAMRPEWRDSVRVVESASGFIETKRELVKCDVVVAARMHCAINALAARVPTVLAAYSRKAEGMAEYVYGNGDWVVPIDELSEEGVLEKTVLSMLSRESEIRRHLAERIPVIQEHAFHPMERLRAELGLR